MKRFLALLFILVSVSVQAQFRFRLPDTLDPAIPVYLKMIQRSSPNVLEVEKAYESYRKSNGEHPFEPYYHHWRRYVQSRTQDDGTISPPTTLVRSRLSSGGATSWRFVGPERHMRRRNAASDPIVNISWHANVYCIDRSRSNPDILYAGTENGGVYKSTDHGLHWTYLSQETDQVTVTAVAVNPFDENDVLVGADERVFRSTDGGVTWTQITSGSFSGRNIAVWQFTYDSFRSGRVFLAAGDSLYRSLDGGNTWSGIFGGQCQSVTANPLNPSVVYALRYDAADKIPYFYKSTDSGSTFVRKPTGWFSVPAVDVGLIESFGGRIATTEADTSRLYVLLVGQSQSTAQLQLNGQIGVYRSDDGGESWSHPHGQIGAPYNAGSHPNMMTFSGGNDTYNQIYYNTTLAVSQLNADRILIGGMSLWRSDDGAASYQPVGGYIGSVEFIHPDNQEFKIYKTSATTEEFWFACDGGINYSTDFVQTHESRTTGIYGTALWGFDQGWNDDIMAGGRYHNGNAARRDGYPDGEWLQLGGGEAATGYVNYSNEKKTYFSDIDGVILPDSIDGFASAFSVNTEPNESYVDNASSRILFDWDYWNIAYLGKDNSIFRSTTGGGSFEPYYSFGSNTSDKVYWIEQSRVNTDVFFAQQVVNNRSVLWKSTDHGVTWSQVSLPQSKRELNFTLSGTDADQLWISYPAGANGLKVYESTNGGASWSNITTPTLDNYTLRAMAHQFGTDGGVYLATYHGPVFYKNHSMTDWSVVGSGLPQASYPLRIVPFYRDGKIRLATWQLGVWEDTLAEASSLIADFSADYRSFYCPGDTLHFVPHCVAGDSATYEWHFTGAVDTISFDQYPDVVYTQVGSFDVTLIVTENGISDSITKVDFIQTVLAPAGNLAEDFETGVFNPNWNLKGGPNGSCGWSVVSTAGGFGNSIHSMFYDNYSYDAAGAQDQVWTSKCDLTALSSGYLGFDVAYSLYGFPYSDTLEVRVSTDCGETFSTLYRKGGQQLATAPSYTAAGFVPLANEWRRDSVDITLYAGYGEVIFAFVNFGWFGQNIYLDNIQVNGSPLTGLTRPDESALTLWPNPVTDRLYGTLPDRQAEVFIYDESGRLLYQQTVNGQFCVEVGDWAPGLYHYRLQQEDGSRTAGKFVKQ